METNPNSAINVKVVPSQYGHPTAIFTTPDGHEYYLHSKYDPMAEAEHLTTQSNCKTGSAASLPAI